MAELTDGSAEILDDMHIAGFIRKSAIEKDVFRFLQRKNLIQVSLGPEQDKISDLTGEPCYELTDLGEGYHRRLVVESMNTIMWVNCEEERKPFISVCHVYKSFNPKKTVCGIEPPRDVPNVIAIRGVAIKKVMGDEFYSREMKVCAGCARDDYVAGWLRAKALYSRVGKSELLQQLMDD